MSEFKIDKEAVSAILYLCDGSSLAGTVYLAPQSPHRAGSQTVEDLMAEAGRMLRFRTAQGRFLLVGKATVAAIRVPVPCGGVPGFWTRYRSKVRLAGPHSMEGDLLLEAGTGLRVSDALNALSPALAVETSEGLLWVSKLHLVSIEAEGG